MHAAICCDVLYACLPKQQVYAQPACGSVNELRFARFAAQYPAPIHHTIELMLPCHHHTLSLAFLADCN